MMPIAAVALLLSVKRFFLQTSDWRVSLWTLVTKPQQEEKEVSRAQCCLEAIPLCWNIRGSAVTAEREEFTLTTFLSRRLKCTCAVCVDRFHDRCEVNYMLETVEEEKKSLHWDKLWQKFFIGSSPFSHSENVKVLLLPLFHFCTIINTHTHTKKKYFQKLCSDVRRKISQWPRSSKPDGRSDVCWRTP